MQVREMLSSHPNVHDRSMDALLHCIDQCFSCAQVCTSCADACLAEPNVQGLVQCIRLDLDCSDMCRAAGLVTAHGWNEHGCPAQQDIDLRKGLPCM